MQDFDYGGNYGEKEVRAQIQATYDTGLTSWMLWDPANRYTPEALNKE
ncbi:MAG: putative glycoside hydrolase [Patescibacteria group bacterium]